MSCGCGNSNSNSTDTSTNSGDGQYGGLFGDGNGNLCGSCLLFWILIGLISLLVINTRK